jgi:peptide/nickel transport system permease protein
MRLAKRLATRLSHVFCVLLVVSFGLAFMLELAPGDPAYAILGDRATDEQVAAVHEELGLDDPIYEQYLAWLAGVAQGDFGESYLSGRPVTEIISTRAGVSFELLILSMGFSLLVSIPVGLATGYKADGFADRLWSIVTSVLVATPSFVIALLLVYVFAVNLKSTPVGLPATGWVPIADGPADNLRHALLPALTLALFLIPQFSRILRADVISTLQEDYVAAARAKGMPNRRILWRHVLRPSSFSLITLAGISMGALIGGAVVVENLFALPGLGQVLYQSIQAKDVLVVRGIVMFIAIAYALINAVVDLLYGVLDPRVRTGS